jgi:hypothetical protein
MAQHRRFTLDLIDTPRPGDAPTIVRLRHVLKGLIRAYGFRCARIEERVGPDQADVAALDADPAIHGETP